MISEDLGFYLLLKKFWQNLGISRKEMSTLPNVMVEMFTDIMMIEEQFETKKRGEQSTKRKF